MANEKSDSRGMIDPLRLADEVFLQQWDWLRVTLSCIGDAVITTDAEHPPPVQPDFPQTPMPDAALRKNED